MNTNLINIICLNFRFAVNCEFFKTDLLTIHISQRIQILYLISLLNDTSAIKIIQDVRQITYLNYLDIDLLSVSYFNTNKFF